MKAEDRIMRAYLKTRDLTNEQAEMARREIGRIVRDMMSRSSERPEGGGKPQGENTNLQELQARESDTLGQRI